jgi:hypothetical protein
MAAVRGSSPRAQSAPTIPDNTSPVPMLASSGPPLRTRIGSEPSLISVGLPFNRTTTPFLPA